jgi:hypothetical protein
MRAFLKRHDLQLFLDFDPGLDQFFRKNIVFSQEMIILLAGKQY